MRPVCTACTQRRPGRGDVPACTFVCAAVHAVRSPSPQVQCMADITIIVFFMGCTLVGVYSRSRVLPVSLHHLRPVAHGTKVNTLLLNCIILQALSIALPVIVWIFGLGPRDAMTVRVRWGPPLCFVWCRRGWASSRMPCL
jgi:hypothetical protein